MNLLRGHTAMLIYNYVGEYGRLRNLLFVARRQNLREMPFILGHGTKLSPYGNAK